MLELLQPKVDKVKGRGLGPINTMGELLLHLNQLSDLHVLVKWSSINTVSKAHMAFICARVLLLLRMILSKVLRHALSYVEWRHMRILRDKLFSFRMRSL